MKLGKTLWIFFSFLLVTTLIGACTFPTTTTDDFEVHFGRPSNGDVIMLGESFELLANGFSSSGEVSRVIFFANGRMVGEAPNRAGGDSIVGSYMWTPTETGHYDLQIAAQQGSTYAYSSPISVCVLPFQISPEHPIDIYAHGYEGDCLIPARSTSAIPGEPVTDTISASPEQLRYVPLYYEYCPDETRFIRFKFYINDPHDDVTFAAILLEVAPARMGRLNSETTLALTHTGDRPPHTKLFTGSIDMHIFLTRSLTDPETGEGFSGELNWIARAFGRDGETLIEEGPFSIPVQPVLCDGSSIITPTSSPTTMPASTSTPQITATPASALNCPPGTYFSENTHKCYTIVVPTEKPANNDQNGNTPAEGGNGVVCSQYGSSNACIAAGCSYNYAKKTCE